jgi:hypothetical protein
LIQSTRKTTKNPVTDAAAKRNRALVREPANEASVSRAIDYLLACTKGSVADCMKSIGIKPKSTQAQQRSQIEKAYRSRELTSDQLGAWLDEIEGWGNHQVHFYTGTATLGAPWKSSESTIAKLDELGVWHLVGASRPLWPTSEPQIYRLAHEGNSLRISWAEERIYEDRVTEKDIVEPNTVWKAYDRRHRRCFHHFEYNSLHHRGALIMGKLPSSGSCPELVKKLLTDAELYFPRVGLQMVDMRPVIKAMEIDRRLLRRRLSLQTTDQTQIEVVSSQKDRDAFEHRFMKKIQSDLIQATSPTKGMFYWTVGELPLQRLIGTRVLPREHRFSIEGQCTEAEVMDVLRGMQTYCK